MKQIWNLIKNFQYKTITSIGLLIISIFLQILTHWSAFSIISLMIFIYLFFNIGRLCYHASRNTYNNNQKSLAIIYGLITAGLIIVSMYLIFSELLF